ncbi:MAG: glycosyltransferase family 39 protein [Candidatus Eremiobacteraeota bacterium]|nr:glycosyltransferase family 39 protein [Candidatus Eremiobacteraeota bacterium]
MIGWALSALAALLHGATAGEYGYFRDELYFIACSKHLAWGYVDQPPLVAVAAWLAAPFGYHLVALRALPIVAAACTVGVAVSIARELGGGRFAQLLTGIATLLLPAYLLLGNVLTTTSFEPLSWSLLIYACLKIVRSSGRGVWWIVAAAAFAFGMYGKYSILLLGAGSIVGMLATPQRRLLLSPWAFVSVLIALVLVAPNLAWQDLHEWPMMAVLAGDAAHRPGFTNGVALEYRNLGINAVAFTIEQIVYTNPFAVPVWLTGVVAPFRVASLRDLRFLSVAYVVVFAVAALSAAKGYYIVGIYASLLAVGAVALESAAGWLRTGLAVAIVLVGIASMPLSIPILPVGAQIAYAQALGLTGHNGSPPQLVQPVFAEEFGWERLARDVGSVYASLPPALRARTAVYADTYADAGAIDFYGPKYGLPPAISSQNSYYLWGTRGYDGQTLIAIGATRIDFLRTFYRSVRLVSTSTEPYKAVVEGPSPIYLCTDPVEPLDRFWPALRWYGA